jgi:hypothetical protein
MGVYCDRAKSRVYIPQQRPGVGRNAYGAFFSRQIQLGIREVEMRMNMTILVFTRLADRYCTCDSCEWKDTDIL